MNPRGVAEPCVATLDGSQFPELVPDGLAWRALWDAAGSGKSPQRLAEELQVEAKAFLQIESVTARTLSKIVQLQRGDRAVAATTVSHFKYRPPSQTDAALAEASLEGRDGLIRDLTLPDYKKVSAWVQRARAGATYSLGRIGSVASDAAGSRRCQASVTGSLRPDLIPDSIYWEAHFRFTAHAAREYMTDADTFAKEYLVVQQRHHMPMPVSDIQLVLALATRTTAKVDALRSLFVAEGRFSLAARQQLAELVLDARAELVRALPDLSWRAVQRDANDTRGGTVFDFPPTPLADR